MRHSCYPKLRGLTASTKRARRHRPGQCPAGPPQLIRPLAPQGRCRGRQRRWPRINSATPPGRWVGRHPHSARPRRLLTHIRSGDAYATRKLSSGIPRNATLDRKRCAGRDPSTLLRAARQTESPAPPRSPTTAGPTAPTGRPSQLSRPPARPGPSPWPRASEPRRDCVIPRDQSCGRTTPDPSRAR